MQYGSAYKQGAERYICNLAQELKYLGNQVIVAGGDPNNIYSETPDFHLVSDQTRHYKLPTDHWSTITGAKPKQYIAFLKRLAPDIVHMIHPGHIGLALLSAAKTLGIKTIITIVDFWWVCPKNTLIHHKHGLCSGNKRLEECSECISQTHPSRNISRLLKYKPGSKVMRIGLMGKLVLKNHYNVWKKRSAIIEETLKSTDSIITLSATAERLLKQHYPNIKTQKIPAGLHPRWYKNIYKWQPPQPKQKKINIGFAGVIAPHKGLHILIEALKRLPNDWFSLKVAGTCNDKNYQKKLNQLTRGLMISWQGSIDEEDMVEFIDRSDLIVVPSLSPENQPQVILEGHARNTPIICSDVPGCAELVDKSLVYDALSAERLANLLSSWKNKPFYKEGLKPISRAEAARRTESIYTNQPGDDLVSCS